MERKTNFLGNMLISGIPNQEILNEMTKDYKKVFFFVDFNNVCKGMYYPEVLTNILLQVKQNNGTNPSSLIREWLVVQNYLEVWAKNFGKTIRCCYFSEAGESYYHTTLYKKYKSTRHNALSRMPESMLYHFNNDVNNINELLKFFQLSSWKWIEAIAKQSNILAIRLNNLDADFIPELLLRKFDIYSDDTCFIILSSDGDIIQTIDYADNIKVFDGNMVITYDNWLTSKAYLKCDANSDLKLSPDRIILFKALVGDHSDNIPGIKGVGKVNFFKKFISEIPADIRADDFSRIMEICMKINKSNPIAKKITENKSEFQIFLKLISFNTMIESLRSNILKYNEIEKLINDNKTALMEPARFLEVRTTTDNSL